jgi:hypothetical protein
MNVIFINLYPKFLGSNLKDKIHLQMKKTIRLLAILLTICFLAGIATSCAVFEDSGSHAQSTKSFKHSKPLPKKWVIDNGEKPILK